MTIITGLILSALVLSLAGVCLCLYLFTDKKVFIIPPFLAYAVLALICNLSVKTVLMANPQPHMYGLLGIATPIAIFFTCFTGTLQLIVRNIDAKD
jgi:hypothetical protein